MCIRVVVLWMNLAILFADIMLDTVAILIVLVSQTAKVISCRAIPATQTSLKSRLSLVVSVSSKLRFWFL